ncbi:hypothetical protein LALCM10_160119 [Dellaglioa algida]|nr:hypothetical protein LALCM10_160119 [Dellaglioa algida]
MVKHTSFVDQDNVARKLLIFCTKKETTWSMYTGECLAGKALRLQKVKRFHDFYDLRTKRGTYYLYVPLYLLYNN